jgi:hypothetical protein
MLCAIHAALALHARLGGWPCKISIFAARLRRPPRAVDDGTLPFGFGFGDLDDATREAIERALEAKDQAAAAAKAAEIEGAWKRLRATLPESAPPQFSLPDDATASMDELKTALATSLDDLPKILKLAAAHALVGNRDALTALASTAKNLRLEDEDLPCIDMAIREGTRRLLGLPEAVDGSDDYAESPGDAAIVARVAKFIARRVCVPHDLEDPEVAKALRCALLRLAKEAEAYAWTASGGLL